MSARPFFAFYGMGYIKGGKIMSYEEKVTKFQGLPVTLNGQPAKITGFKNKFATVATLNPNGPAFEWSWETIARIVRAGGNFKS